MTIRDIWHNFVSNIKDKYTSIQKISSKISADFKDLFQYNANSLDKMIFQSSGVVGLYDDMVNSGKTTFQKLYTIKNDFNQLENILFNKHHPMNEETDIPFYKTSRLKSTIISTIVGLGTMNYTYNALRKTDNDISLKSTYYDVHKLNTIIDLKNKYFWKNNDQLKEIIIKETNININNIESIVNEAMNMKVNNPLYSNINRINYDSRIASQKMKDEFIAQYTSSEKTLKEISSDLEKKYGMYISASTISRYARKHLSSKNLEFKNRKEAKKYYQH